MHDLRCTPCELRLLADGCVPSVRRACPGHSRWSSRKGGLPIGASSSIGDDRGGNPMELTLLSYEIGIRRRRRGPVDA